MYITFMPMPLIPNGVSEPFGSSNDTAVGWVERSLIDSACYKY